MSVEHQPGGSVRIYNGSNVLLSPRATHGENIKYLPFHFGEKQLTGLSTGSEEMLSIPSSDPLVMALGNGGDSSPAKEHIH